MLMKTALQLFFFATLTAVTVVCGEENTKPLYTLFPSSVPSTQNDSDDKTSDEVQEAEVNPYVCGDYSRATRLGNADTYFSRTAIVEYADHDPMHFIRADVSCAFEPDRKIFDNDYSRRNNIKDKFWDPEKGNPVHELQNDISILNGTIDIFHQAGGSQDNYEDEGIKIPKNIHIRMYAIDDDLEFRYRSHPFGLITPVYDVIPSVQFNNESYTNSTLLRFVWNQMRTKNKFQSFFKNPYKNSEVNATLEMWIPNWILERSIILGPRYDYSLGMEIGGTVNHGSSAGNNEATRRENNETLAVNNDDPKLLSTKGSPSRLVVLNNGIGTEVTLVLNTTSRNSGVELHTALKFVDESLNGEVRIKTDKNVSGTIRLDGSNVRAAIVQTTPEFPKTTREKDSGDGIEVNVNGFQQVVTVRGNYNEIVLEGTSVALYTTEGCSEKDGVTISTKQAKCYEIDENVDRTLSINKHFIREESGETTFFQNTADSLQLRIDAIGFGNVTHFIHPTYGSLQPLLPAVFLPRSCMVKTKTFEYNCNPLSSGAMSMNFVGWISSIPVSTIVATLALI